jgi:hypothetical protein
MAGERRYWSFALGRCYSLLVPACCTKWVSDELLHGVARLTSVFSTMQAETFLVTLKEDAPEVRRKKVVLPVQQAETSDLMGPHEINRVTQARAGPTCSE